MRKPVLPGEFLRKVRKEQKSLLLAGQSIAGGFHNRLLRQTVKNHSGQYSARCGGCGRAMGRDLATGVVRLLI